MKTSYKATAWVGAGGLGLLVLGVVVVMFLNTPRSISKESSVEPITPKLIANNSPIAESPISPPAELVGPRLPPIDYPLGSIGFACDVNKFPPAVVYWSFEPDRREIRPQEKDPSVALQNEECSTTVEQQMYAINPYLWGKENETWGTHLAFEFVNIDNPLTFERIFTDPTGDFVRVQEALARPECQLGQNVGNWQLKETCHADAILNYALVTRFCYQEEYYNFIVDYRYGNGVNNRTRQSYRKEDNPTPEQDRSMWIQELEGRWVREKCKTLDPSLDLQSPVHTELRKQIHLLQPEKSLNATLIDLAARLGDAAAGLTYPFSVGSWVDHVEYGEEGYKHSPFTPWFTTKRFDDPKDLFTKHPPSAERMRRLVRLFAEERTQDGISIDYNHEALVQYLCTPPYYTSPWVDEDTIPEPPSCRTIVIELHQEFHDNQTILGYIATFEDVAMRLDVYE